MSSYTAPLSDLRFALHDVLKVEPLFARLGFTDATADVVDAVLEEAGRFSASVLAPLNSVGDEIGCVLDQATGERALERDVELALDAGVHIPGGLAMANGQDACGFHGVQRGMSMFTRRRPAGGFGKLAMAA